MKLRRQRNSFTESAALSDLAFLLIIYFIVIAGFNVNRGFLLSLPQKNSVKAVPREELLRFRLDDAGNLVSGENKIETFAEAEAAISAAIAANPATVVVLAVSPEAPWQSVVSFVDIAQKLKVEAFSFSMDNSHRYTQMNTDNGDSGK
jgi:biopolymer transport protein ExbD